MPHPLKIEFTRERLVINLSWTTALKTLLAFGLSIAAGLIPIPGLDAPARTCLVIFVMAATLWVTELIPPYATAIMVIVLCVYLLGDPNAPLDPERGVTATYRIFLNPIASPILVLFFGGFILALGATKHGFDVQLARAFVTPFGQRPAMVLLGVIFTTGLFSMFMSNTATTAMMIAMLNPFFLHLEERPNLRKMLVLAVPFAANIGGMGTVIGTPPNAVAASVLAGLGHPISFLRWMTFGVPLVAVLLFVLWRVLLLVFPPRKETLEITFPRQLVVTPGLAVVVTTFTVTILMWLSEPLHHIPTAVVAMLPIAAFTAFGIISRDDLKKLDWDVLILIAGGMTLGVAMRASGLSDALVQQIPFGQIPVILIVGVVALLTVLIANFMSHTSAANLLIPIVTSIGALSPILGALTVALAASLAMSLPISTPPNAIAFATRAVTTRDLVKYGTIVSVSGLLLVVGLLVGVSYWLGPS
jgi:sodium-dependent dicarboxylate transporter 2/3/5